MKIKMLGVDWQIHAKRKRKERLMFALTNAEIETIEKGRISNGTVVVNDGKILSVGNNVEIPEGADITDVEGRLITPGLIEAHSHAGMSEDGFPADADYNEKTDPVTPHLLAIDGFKPTDVAMLEAAEAGVTTMYLTPRSGRSGSSGQRERLLWDRRGGEDMGYVILRTGS